MEEFAEYILNEEDLIAKEEIIYLPGILEYSSIFAFSSPHI